MLINGQNLRVMIKLNLRVHCRQYQQHPSYLRSHAHPKPSRLKCIKDIIINWLKLRLIGFEFIHL